MKRNVFRTVLDIILFLLVFSFLQLFFALLVGFAAQLYGGAGISEALKALAHGDYGTGAKELILSSALSSVATIALFFWRRWAEPSRRFLKTRPWGVLVWVVVLTVGTILPSQWLQEEIDVAMPQSVIDMFSAIMGQPAGYLTIGILVPIAEEVVFRGAVLRALLAAFSPRWRWGAIVVSALIFGAVHGNVAQFTHAFLIGLLLGWLYARTRSIVPGIALHWVNNSIAFAMFNLMPSMADGKLIDLFHGDDRMMWLSLGFSLLIILPSLLQLHLRMPKETVD